MHTSGNPSLAVLARVVFGTYFLFMLGFFFIPNAVDQYKFYSIAVFIPALLLLPGMLKTIGYDRLFGVIALYLLWMLASSYWSESFDFADFMKTLRLVLYIMVFVLLTAYVANREPAAFAQAVAVICTGAAVAAVVSVPLWYADNPFPSSRIVGIGTLDNPNPSSFVYGFFTLFSCQLALTHDKASVRLVFLVSTLLLVGYVVLTQSNTGILATVFSIALLLLLRSNRRRRHLLGGIAITGAAAVFLAYSIGILDHPMDGGLSERIPIWRKVIEQIEQAPLIGHGFQKQLLVYADGSPDVANYAHSGLLASFRDGGLIAVVLHASVLGIALVTAVRRFRQDGDPAFLAYLLFGFICMSADTDQLVTRPRELWVIFWWPLAMIIAYRVGREALPPPSGHKSTV